MASKKIMTAIKRAVSPNPQRADAPTASNTLLVSKTPLTDFICSRLEGEKLQLFGMMFAEAIKNDRHAKVVVFENVYRYLGYDRYDNAVRQLKNHFKDSELVFKNLLTGEEVSKNARGPNKQGILISIRQFEKLLVEAETAEGALARDMMLEVKDTVQDYIKMEMEEASRMATEEQIEELTSQPKPFLRC